MVKPKDGIWIINAEAHTVYANDNMAEILGTTPDEMLGESSFVYIYPEDMLAAERLFASKKEGNPAPFPFRLRRKDGSPIRVEVLGTPMHNAAGHFTGVVGMFTVAE